MGLPIFGTGTEYVKVGGVIRSGITRAVEVAQGFRGFGEVVDVAELCASELSFVPVA